MSNHETPKDLYNTLTLEEQLVDGKTLREVASWDPKRIFRRVFAGPPVTGRGKLQKPTETVAVNRQTSQPENPPLFRASHSSHDTRITIVIV